MEPKYNIGDSVILVTDHNQNIFIVTAIRDEGDKFRYYISHAHFNEILVDAIQIKGV